MTVSDEDMAVLLGSMNAELALADQVVIRTWADQLHARLRAENAQLQQEAEERERVSTKMADLLTRTVAIVRGKPPEDTLWSWHDLPELVEGLKQNSERYIYVRPIMTGESSKEADRITTNIALSLVQGLSGDDAVDAAMGRSKAQTNVV